MYVPQRPAIHPGTPMDLFNMAKKYASQKGKYFDDPVSSSVYDGLHHTHILIIHLSSSPPQDQNWYGLEFICGSFQ